MQSLLSLLLRHPPTSTLFPYTTLFRSLLEPAARINHPRRPGSASDGDRWRPPAERPGPPPEHAGDRKSTRLNSSHVAISYAVFCLKIKRHIGRKILSNVNIVLTNYIVL